MNEIIKRFSTTHDSIALIQDEHQSYHKLTQSIFDGDLQSSYFKVSAEPFYYQKFNPLYRSHKRTTYFRFISNAYSIWRLVPC